MGKVTDMVNKLRAMGHTELLDRFRHVASALAIRDYIAAKSDLLLSMEVKLSAEEIIHRMATKRPSPHVIIPDEQGIKK